jgi:hypothetical protein
MTKLSFTQRSTLPKLLSGLLVSVSLIIIIGACADASSTDLPAPATTAPAVTGTREPNLASASPTHGGAHVLAPTAAQPGSTAYPQPYPPPEGTSGSYPPPPSPTLSPSQVSQEGPLPPNFYFPFIIGGIPPATSTPLPPTATLPPPATLPPTPSPTPAWPEPLTGQPASKIGLHVIAVNADPYVLEFVRRVHPRVINAPADAAGLALIKAASPGTVTLSRVDVPGQNVWVDTVPDAAAAANHYVDVNLQKYQQNPSVDYWLGINEFNPQSVADWNWFTTFEATRACTMQAHGLHAAIGDFGVGWPNSYDQMTLFLPALEAAHRCGAIFSVHEYNGPLLSCGVATNTPGIIPGAPALSVPAGALTLRYRFWYESFLKPRHLDDVPLVVTELSALGGPVGSNTCGGQGDMTWKAYQKSWIKLGLGATGPEAYVNVLAWYDAELKKDPYVLGAAIFTAGEYNGNPWYAFDVHDVLVPLAQYEAQP